MDSNLALNDQVFFELPGSSRIKGIPIIFGGKNLSFGFIEVGCNPDGKRSQLKNKKELFYKYWADIYVKNFNINWYPKIFRILAHYHPSFKVPLETKKYEVDVSIHYSSITDEMIKNLNDDEKKELFFNVGEGKKQLLEKIIENCDEQALMNFITNSDLNGRFHGILRGKIAEILVLKDLERVLPCGVNLYRNGDIRYINRRYRNGTEIDGVLSFYGEDKFTYIIDSLEKFSHLSVERK